MASTGVDNENPKLQENEDLGIKIATIFGFLLVVLGMVNNIPSIPGLEDTIANIFNAESVLIRKFPYEWLHPIAFIIMMLENLTLNM